MKNTLAQPDDSNSQAEGQSKEKIEVKRVDEGVTNGKAKNHARASDSLQDWASFAVNRKADQFSYGIASASRQQQVEQKIRK